MHGRGGGEQGSQLEMLNSAQRKASRSFACSTLAQETQLATQTIAMFLHGALCRDADLIDVKVDADTLTTRAP
jgi:hypothetical protein